MKKMLLIVVLSLFVCGIAGAANATGVWRGKYDAHNVEMTLKQTGKRIKGSMVGTESDSYVWSIKGKIVGNNIELIFTGITGYSDDGDYSGTVEGDIIDLDSTTFGRIYECKKVE